MDALVRTNDLGIKAEEIKEFLGTVDKFRLVIAKNPITTPPTEVQEQADAQLHLPYKGEFGEIIWDHPDPTQLPEFLNGLTEQIRAVFGLKREVKSFLIRIFPPPSAEEARKNPNKITEIKRVEQHLSMQVTRLFIAVGSTENLHLTVSAGGKNKASEGTVVRSGQGCHINFGFVGNTDVSWNNKTFYPIPARKGWRTTTMKKTPTSRYMIVVDCINDMNVVFQAIKKDIAAASVGDSAKEERIRATLADAFAMPELQDKEREELLKTIPAEDLISALASKAESGEVPLAGLPIVTTPDKAVDLSGLPVAASVPVVAIPGSPKEDRDIISKGITESSPNLPTNPDLQNAVLVSVEDGVSVHH